MAKQNLPHAKARKRMYKLRMWKMLNAPGLKTS
jgi:hypothetical protein